VLLHKPWALSMGEGDFRSRTAPRPLNRFSCNLKYIKYITIFWTRPRMQNFKGLCRRGWSGQIVSFTHESFFLFCLFLRRSHLWTTPTLNTSLYVALAKVVSFGVRKMKFEIWPPLPTKKRKTIRKRVQKEGKDGTVRPLECTYVQHVIGAL